MLKGCLVTRSARMGPAIYIFWQVADDVLLDSVWAPAWLPVSTPCRILSYGSYTGSGELAVVEAIICEKIQPVPYWVLLLSNDVEENPGPPR